MKNKANFIEGEMSVCSLKTIYYVDFMRFVAEKNKANYDKTPETRFQTEDKDRMIIKEMLRNFQIFFKRMELFRRFICLRYWSKDYD